MIFLFVIIVAYYLIGLIPWLSINTTNTQKKNIINLITKKMIILFLIINLYGVSILNIMYSICCVCIVSFLNKDYKHINMSPYKNYIKDFIKHENEKVFSDIPFYEIKNFFMRTHAAQNNINDPIHTEVDHTEVRKKDTLFAKTLQQNNNYNYNISNLI